MKHSYFLNNMHKAKECNKYDSNRNCVPNFDGNPFVEDTFSKIWIKHFGNGRKQLAVKGLKPLRFVRLRLIGVLLNIGANKTYGLCYNIDKSKLIELNEVLLIKDVHTFFRAKEDLKFGLRKRTIKRYPGFLVDMREFDNLDQYLKTRFSKNRIRRLRLWKKRLELCYNIEYKFYEKNISVGEHRHLFSKFKMLLKKRYSEKAVKNIFLQEGHWSFQHELSYELINEGKASLFVMFANEEPIAICLNYLANETVILGMIAFDTDYERFNIGHLSINEQMQYYYGRGYEIIDFSQSVYSYKLKLCNVKYYFEYHFLYNPKFLKHNMLSAIIWLFYKILTVKYNITKKLDASRMRHLKTFFIFKKKTKESKFKFYGTTLELFKEKHLYEVFKDKLPEHLKKPINYFIYKHSVKFHELLVYQIKEEKNTFLFSGNGSVVKVVIDVK